MSYLHSHEIIHRDLKTDNVLLDNFLLPKVSDFGLSKSFTPTSQSALFQTKAGTIKGTPIYIAPEIWSRSLYSKLSDVYAFSIVVFEIMTCQKPYPDIDVYSLGLSVLDNQRPKFNVEIPDAYKYLIERCWSQNPENRPTFDQILTELRTDRSYITDSINEEEYFNYIKFIDEYETTFDSTKVVIPYSNFSKYQLNWEILNNNIQLSDFNDNLKLIHLVEKFPYKYIKFLGEESKKLVLEAEDDFQLKFEVGRNLIEGRYDFPIDLKIGLDLIKESMNNGNKDSLIYYIKMLIKGNIIPQNHKKVHKLIETKFEKEDSLYSLLYGQLCKSEKQYSKAEEYFKQSMNLENSYAMYEYAKLIRKGYCESQNLKDNSFYFKKAIDKGNLQAIYKYGVILNNENEKEEGNRLIKLAVDKGYNKALYYYGIKLEEEKDDKNNDLLMDCFKKAANEGHIKSMNKYGFKLIDKLSEGDKKDEPFNYLKKASDKGCFESMWKCGELIICEQLRISHDLKEGARYIKIAAYKGIARALSLYGYILKNGKGVDANFTEAAKFYKLAIDKGDIDAMNNYGHMLYNGIGVDTNCEEAIKYFKMSIEKGNCVDAMNNYAYALCQGDKKENDLKEAIKYYKMAIDNGNPHAMNNYALMLIFGSGVEKNVQEGIKYLKMSIDQGSTIAMNSYAHILQNGIGIEVNFKEAIRYYKILIDKGFPFGMHNYATMLQNGQGCEVIYKEAIKYYQMAINKGFAPAMTNYAYMLEKLLGNKEEAIKYYKMAIDKKDRDAMLKYGLFLCENEDENNKKEGIEYITKASDLKNVEAQSTLALKYLKGDCVQYDKEKGLKLYKMSAKNGNIKSQINLGYIYRKGYKGIVEKNNKKAIKYYSMAASKGNKIAQFNLGVLYLKGDHDVQIDTEKSFHFLKLAADQNDSDAELNLGVLYARKENHSSDCNKSISIFEKLAKLNNSKAKFNLDIIHSNKKESIEGKIEEKEDDFLFIDEKELSENEFELGHLYIEKRNDNENENRNKNDNDNKNENKFEILYEFLIQKINCIKSSIENPINQSNIKLDNIHTQFINIGLTDCINTYTKVNNSLQIIENDIHTFLSTKKEENITSHLPFLRKETKFTQKEDNEQNSTKIIQIQKHEKITSDEDESKELEKTKFISNDISNDPSKNQNYHSSTNIQKRPSPRIIKILKKKSEEGDAVSQMQLGAYYSRSANFLHNESIAFEYFLKAANQGDKNAQFFVGTCYSYGKGTEIDKNTAFQYYLKSAEQGYHKAQFAVGHFYLYHKDSSKENNEKALEWYKKAAAQGNRAAIKAIQNNFND